MEKSIYEQLNEIDDTLCLENWKKDEEVLEEESNSQKIFRKLSEVEDEDPKTLADIEASTKDSNIKTPLTDEQMHQVNQVKTIEDLQSLLHQFTSDNRSIRQKLRDAGFNV